MPNLIDITGRKYGRLTVLKRATTDKAGTYWEVSCSCGNVVEALYANLAQGRQQSCGCLRRELAGTINFKHGKSRTRVHRVWQGMLTRCLNRNSQSYGRYGGRGITVCDEWLVFEAFYIDMGDPPLGLTLERTDNDKGYSKDNCVWASPKVQANNTRKVYGARTININGEEVRLMEAAKTIGLTVGCLRHRVFRGWELARILGQEPRKVQRK